MQRKRFSQWPEVIFGTLFVILGASSFVAPSFAFSMMTVLYGLIALLSGVNELVNYFIYEWSSSRSFISLSLFTGALSTLVGAYILFNVTTERVNISFIFLIWLILSSAFALAGLRQVRFFSGNLAFALILAASLSGLVLGIFLLINRSLSELILVYALGGYLILQGAGSIVAALTRWRRGM